MVANESPLDIDNFKNNFNYLKLNIETGEKINFLDLTISYDFLTNKFVTSLYTKPTNTFSYLISISNHPQHIFKNIPKSLFIRLRRICSSHLDYIFQSRILINQLEKRGYNFYQLKKIAQSIGHSPRKNFLNYKKKKEMKLFSKNINLFQIYDFSLDFFKRSTLNAFIKTKYEYEDKLKYLKNLELKVYFSIGTNIGAYLIHGFKNKIKQNFYFNRSCKTPFCKTCLYLKEDCFIKINTYIIPILSNSDCHSLGIIYIIACNCCNKYYIGESKRSANTRFTEHLKNILNFKHNMKNSIMNFAKKSEVATHFNCSRHNIGNNLEFYILNSNILDDSVRKSKETDLMHFLKLLKINILNKKIPDKKYIKNLFFFNSNTFC
jgi:hypothetical protein